MESNSPDGPFKCIHPPQCPVTYNGSHSHNLLDDCSDSTMPR